jgi:Protein of unknown function (DUF2750).
MDTAMSQLTSDLNANYELLLTQARETGVLWGLQFGEDWVVCDSNDFAETDVLPLWSSEEAARAHCVEEWSDYSPVAIDLEIFFDEWVNDLGEDGVLIGTNWNDDLDGLEVDPLELAKDLAEVDE